jgi:C-terminal processing protease CtpA/Prc
MRIPPTIALGILAAGLPVAAYCAGAFQTGNIGVALGGDLGSGPAKIATVFPNSPAHLASVKTNWIILSIDGENMLGAGSTNCMKRLHGTVGTPVTLELADPQTHQTNKFVIKRQDVPMPENLFQNFFGTNAPERRGPNSLKSFLITN